MTMALGSGSVAGACDQALIVVDLRFVDGEDDLGNWERTEI